MQIYEFLQKQASRSEINRHLLIPKASVPFTRTLREAQEVLAYQHPGLRDILNFHHISSF